MRDYEDEFTTGDIQRLLRIPRERFREWIAKDFICPTCPAPGQGERAIFNKEALLKVVVFKTLIEHGMQRRAAAEFVRKFYNSESDIIGGELHECFSLYINFKKTKDEVEKLIAG